MRFELVKIEEIRDEDFYPGYRVTVHYNLEGLTDNIKFDLTTGDSIIPEVQSYKHQSILLDKTIKFLAYPIEQVLSEKLHTIIERNVLTTRMRDFYDIYTLIKMQENVINFVSLKNSFENTMQRRKAVIQPNDYQKVIEVLSVDENVKKLWHLYQSNYSYAEDIAYKDTIQTIRYLMDRIQKVK
ncbi:nucleotidyl transferase AbiEii/AbiGii toxin family protein [Tetragenococcus halophilus]|uniref:nucleotidyl transferase AbiEii/AbiGii toxin family protein n=1 Tax=Tetragenococcus halophilus TaxID=51669 RepID=UPI00209A8B7F|nr:nucleotidyl transferase AbiEii/AbiGii toxin family protein [Tetragenococcus halophilus]